MEASSTFGRINTWDSSPLLAPSRPHTRSHTPATAMLPVDSDSQASDCAHTKPAGKCVYILADADTFYASCERVFHPNLAHAPVVVLSNNDGCVITRTAEAKPFVPRGTPWYQIREQATEKGAVARSSNYELYGSLSARMMTVMHHFFAHQEVASIDECFLRSSLPLSSVITTALAMRQAVWQGVGIPLSIGVAPTKTLAKVVNHEAKHSGGNTHLMCWNTLTSSEKEDLLVRTPISEVWGVGRRLTHQLISLGIVTALQLRNSDPVEIKHRFSVFLQRTVLELREIPCIQEEADADNGVRTGMIFCSRMFSHPVYGRIPIAQALTVYAQDACRRLRRQNSLAGAVGIFAGISPFAHEDADLSVPLTVGELPTPSDNPLVIVDFICHQLLPKIHIDPHARFVRAGVMLTDLQNAADYHPLAGFAPQRDSAGIGHILDHMNQLYGDHSVGIGFAGIRGIGQHHNETGASWNMHRNMLSNRGTTRWDEMTVVHAD